MNLAAVDINSFAAKCCEAKNENIFFEVWYYPSAVFAQPFMSAGMGWTPAHSGVAAVDGCGVATTSIAEGMIRIPASSTYCLAVYSEWSLPTPIYSTVYELVG